MASCKLLDNFFNLCKGQGRVYRALEPDSKWYLNLGLSHTTSENVTICEQYVEMTSLAKCWQNTEEKYHKISYKDNFKVTDKLANIVFLVICSVLPSII